MDNLRCEGATLQRQSKPILNPWPPGHERKLKSAMGIYRPGVLWEHLSPRQLRCGGRHSTHGKSKV